MDVAKGKRLSTVNWFEAALEQIAAAGTESVSVEGLARQLGVTKGSFYWHFQDRADLISQALDYWAEHGTDRVIEEMGRVEDPAKRLRSLLRSSLSDTRGPLDVMLATSVGDPVIAAVVERVTKRRLEFLVDAFRQLGMTQAQAERRSAIAYAAYIGHFQLARALGKDVARLQASRTYLDELVESLVPLRPTG